MKTTWKLLPAIAAICLLAGCSAQKQAAKSVAVTAESEALYAQALKALEDGRFVIEAEEFYFPRKSAPVRYSPGSYISMQSNYLDVVFAPGLFPADSFLIDGRNIGNDVANIARTEKKNGDIQFSITIPKNQQAGHYNKVLIILYKDTNKCFVRINEGYGNEASVSLAGLIRPIEK